MTTNHVCSAPLDGIQVLQSSGFSLLAGQLAGGATCDGLIIAGGSDWDEERQLVLL